MPNQSVTNIANAIINKINSLISSHNSNSNAHPDIRGDIPSASSTTPSADTTSGSVGAGITWAKSDHTHPKSNLYAEASHTHSQYLTQHQSLKTINNETLIGTGDITIEIDEETEYIELSVDEEVSEYAYGNTIELYGASTKDIIDNTTTNAKFLFKMPSISDELGYSQIYIRLHYNNGNSYKTGVINKGNYVYMFDDAEKLSNAYVLVLLSEYSNSFMFFDIISKSNYAEPSHTHSLNALRFGNDFDYGWESISLFTQDNDNKSVDVGGIITLDYSNNEAKATYNRNLGDYSKDYYEIATIEDIGYTIRENIGEYVSAVALSNDYDDLDNKPTIPTATSDLVNDSGFLTSHQSLTGYLQQSDVKNNLTSTDTNKPLSALQGKELKTLVDGKASSSHTHNTTEIRDSSAYNRIGSDVNDTQAEINNSIDSALADLDDNILYTKMSLVGFQEFQVKDFINPNNWENSGCTYSDGVLTFSGSNSFTATFPTDSLVGELADFELSFDYIIDDGLILDDIIDFDIFGRETNYGVTEADINDGYVIIDVSFKSENNMGTITSEATGDEWPIDDVGSLNPYTINAITPVGNSTKIANIRYKANNIISLNDNKEDVYNKVTSISSSSTDTQYPSAKCVFDKLNGYLTSNEEVIFVNGTNQSTDTTTNTFTGTTSKLDSIDSVVNGTKLIYRVSVTSTDDTNKLRLSLGTNSGVIERYIKSDNTYTTANLYPTDTLLFLVFFSNTWHIIGQSNPKLKNRIVDLIYPIGSIYMSVNNVSPQTLFGGSWEQIQDTFLLASGSTYSPGSTGGSATVTLTSAQSGVPAHSHKYQDYNTTYTLKTTNRKPGTSTAVAYGTSLTAGGGATERTSSNNTAANASQAHENMPPYLAVYMWERVG